MLPAGRLHHHAYPHVLYAQPLACDKYSSISISMHNSQVISALPPRSGSLSFSIAPVSLPNPSCELLSEFSHRYPNPASSIVRSPFHFTGLPSISWSVAGATPAPHAASRIPYADLALWLYYIAIPVADAKVCFPYSLHAQAKLGRPCLSCFSAWSVRIFLIALTTANPRSVCALASTPFFVHAATPSRPR